jgi:hypothetical protein
MKMNRMILIAMTAFLPLVAGIAQQPTEAELPKMMDANGQQMTTPDLPMPLAPSPDFHVIRQVPGPILNPGWVLVGAEAVLRNGNTLAQWQLYVFKPSTRQTYGILIGLP